MLVLGQYKCLAEGERPQEAAALLEQVTATLLPRVRLSEADPATAWDMTSTLAIAAARALKSEIVVDAVPAAIEVLLPQLKSGHQGAEAMVGAALLSCLRAFALAQHWAPAHEVAAAVSPTRPRPLLRGSPAHRDPPRLPARGVPRVSQAGR